MPDVRPETDEEGAARCVWCSACGARFSAIAWSSLALLERVSASDARKYVTPWPEGVCVEIRPCSRCGKPLARKVLAV